MFAPGAFAASGDLFISEVVEGSTNNKALEIFNDTDAPIDLAAQGYNVQMFFNGSATAGLTINLAGTLADDDVFVLAHASADPAILAVADQTNGAGWFNGDDAVVLRKGTDVIDVVGQIGFDPGTEWGTGLTSTADNTLRRKATVTDGDLNGADVFDPAGRLRDERLRRARRPFRRPAAGGSGSIRREHDADERREQRRDGRVGRDHVQRAGRRHAGDLHDLLHDERCAPVRPPGLGDELHP